MTDTQADLTERARPVWVKLYKWRHTISDDDAAEMIAAFAQSEREAAAAEARIECESVAVKVRDGGTVEGKNPGAAWFNACMNVIDGIRSLASPAPQEET
jgi:hypothetical protein